MAKKNNNEVQITFKAFNQEFNSAMKEMDESTKSLRQEMKLQQEQMKYTATSTEQLEAKMNGLQQVYEVQRQKTEQTAQALDRAKELWGDSSTEVAKMEAALKRHQIAEQQTANAIQGTEQAIRKAQQAQSQQEQSYRDLNNLLQVTGRSIDDFSSTLGSDLVSSIKSGEANAKDLERAFRQVGRATQTTATDIDALRSVVTRLDGSNIDEIRRDMEQLSGATEEAEKSIGGLEALLGAIGGVVAGAGISEIFKSALDVSELETQIDIAFNIPPESKAAVKKAISDVKTYGVDGAEALEGVRRQWALNKDATDEVNAGIVEGAAAISKVYSQIDFVELIQETNEIAGELKIADEEALNLVNDLLKVGFPTEQIDTIAEYGQQLQRAGYNATEIQAIMASAVKTDSFNIDNLLDGLKEGRIRATEMGAGLKDSFKESIAEVTNTTKQLTDEQITAMEDSLSDQEEALSKSMDRRYKAVDKSYQEQEDALKKSLDAQTEAVEDNFDRQEKELDKSLSNELKAYEKLANQKIKLIDKEYTERLKLIDEERYNAIKAVEDEIKSIEGLMDADNRATEQAENAQKRAQLQRAVDASTTTYQRRAAEKELAEFEAEVKAKALEDERKQTISALKEQKDDIKELYDDKKDEIRSEYELAKEKAQESISIEKEAIQERQNLEREAFKQRKDEYLENVRENHSNELKSYQEMNDTKLEQLKELQEKELEQLQKTNAKRIELAKNPPDSALFTSTVSQLEKWGKAVAGGEGTEEFKEMVEWLNSIEDAALRNIIGIELFGTKWEDQGENITETILGMDQAMKEMNETQSDVKKDTEEIGENDGWKNFYESIATVEKALNPLMGLIAETINKISKWITANPVLVSTLYSIFTVVGIIAGALASLAPVIFTITTLFGAGSVGGGLISAIAKLGPILMNLALKIIPALRLAFSVLGGPITIAIGILTLAIPLIIKNWDSISGFFSRLFKKLGEIFTGSVAFVKDLFRKWGPELLAILVTGPLGRLSGWFQEKYDSVFAVTKTVFGRIERAITGPIDRAREAIRLSVDKIKSFFNFEFKWPEVKIPKFSIKKGSLNPLTWFTEGFPELDIQFFKNGGILNAATVFGGSGNTAFVGGEAGKEAVLPLNERVLGTIGRAIFAAAGGQTGETIVHNYERMLEGATFVIREEADVRRVARELYDLQQIDRRGR